MPNADVEIVTVESEVDAALEERGLTLEILHAALEAGAAAAALCTPNHPRVFRGWAQWSETVRSLRDQLGPAGWHPHEADNFPTVARNDAALAIAVAGGNPDTGRPDGHPTTRHSKGPVLSQCVATNLYLPFGHLPQDLNSPPPIWLLLHYRAEDELRAELSFPVGIDSSGFVTAWAIRIILPSIDLIPPALTLDEHPVAPEVLIGGVGAESS